MYPERVRAEALARLAGGESLARLSRDLRVGRATLRAWRDEGSRPARRGECPRCQGARLDGSAYSCLLGYYLGDGCISAAPRYFALRVSCDQKHPGIITAVEAAVQGVRPRAHVFHVPAPGTVVLQSHWKHWPCLFPQHGPGRKHERAIVLEPWQRAVVEAHPAEFLFTIPTVRGRRAAGGAARRTAAAGGWDWPPGARHERRGGSRPPPSSVPGRPLRRTAGEARAEAPAACPGARRWPGWTP